MTPYFTYGQNFYCTTSNQFSYYPFYGMPNRQYPTVDPATFMSSAKDMENIMRDVSLLLTKMASSRTFSFQLMSAAQASQQDKVSTIIKSTGIKHIPKVRYTPDGLVLEFESANQLQNCCSLLLKLRWK
ncbi:hypothetical protein RRV45_18160 [Bacillus sp. DTU_2020_1000418_1_SI_GHA_SEK_038]|uniref:hypothetical protein n=1 Tax=Bacillus sp. DTU_2020_1000418_1_SI_GHA_SEK_038 TaxID=3077585 RepID=UPI0028EE6249|nr:hypothetical protein [Bacillus sp. DTU_2020_1000418_1_SI_GHA_SEK_038]WNS74789.1 hypothetical protein RRV45_18160 [Bacillus sp. DTU_2020_1000418_1_SI_GHA_SEK_038]